MNDTIPDTDPTAATMATIERVAELIHKDERTLVRIFELVPGGNIVSALAHVLGEERYARAFAWALGRLIRTNPIYVATLFEHSLFCDIDEDEWSNEKLLKVLRERLAI